MFDLEEEFDIREIYPLQNEAMCEILDDPAMDVYNQCLPDGEEPSK